jgi:uncharacterized protein (UPF0332 family)
MISPEIQRLLDYADDSHKAARTLMKGGFTGFSAAQSYYTMFYLAEALLFSKELTFSSHSAIIAAFGKEFAKTGIIDLKFHRYLIDAQERREIGHYGTERKVTDEQALESYQWAGEFKQVANNYLGKV